jgi:hypothetical protein
VDVDAEGTGRADDPLYVRPAAGELLPAAALAGADDDLGDLVLPREAGDPVRRIVVLDLRPERADVGGDLAQPAADWRSRGVWPLLETTWTTSSFPLTRDTMRAARRSRAACGTRSRG